MFIEKTEMSEQSMFIIVLHVQIFSEVSFFQLKTIVYYCVYSKLSGLKL